MLNNLACPNLNICPLFTSPLLATASLVLSFSFNALLKAGRVPGFTTMLCISNHKPQFIVDPVATLLPLSNLDFRRSFTTISTTPHQQHHHGFFPLTVAFNHLKKPSLPFIINVTTTISIAHIPLLHQRLRIWHGCRVLEPIKEQYYIVSYDDFYQNLLYDLMFPSIQLPANPSSIQSLCGVIDLQ
ncbi:uncharacterized protein LOC111888097 [Lactuca sativa]|uniref:Uncharacterized protein n=1 Tax=Lactuca sativa TaxID=4236 RepID=A0A9R1W0P6_LACSA|nr:uncharacterized protein LOC111888097 [Lactuca sativa]KAJ0215024.1 hypothetical protein LSAT_V11C300150550 [Lactuca sativa]